MTFLERNGYQLLFVCYHRPILTVAADICTYLSENVLQFIYGQKDMGEWDSFVETVRGMGVDTAIEAKQAAYDDYLNS